MGKTASEGYTIFIVEDDLWYSEILNFHLSLNPDYNVVCFDNGSDCLKRLHEQPDLITIDFSLPDMNGDQLFRKIRKVDATVPVIVISSQEEVSIAVELLKQGVTDYIVKDDTAKDLLWNSVIQIRENQHLKEEVEQLREELGKKMSFEKTMIGQSDALKEVFRLMEKSVLTNINVSITGETGTGKEQVAKAIHYSSKRKKRNFVAVNMAAIPKDLIESELFGHEKGAFTGATARKAGKFEAANGGTIFLDEIAELDMSLQSKVLRVLQEREVVRVGGQEKIKLDVRLIVATHRDLAEEVQKGRFREDLYYRVMGLPIALPPLRERGNDILILAKHFIDAFATENKLGTFALSDGAKQKLLRYDFPGNVRELKSLVELAVVMCDSREIREEDLTFTASRKENLLPLEHKTLREHTCDIIKYYLNKNNNDVIKTAKKLDIGKSTIYKMMRAGELG